MNKKAILLIVPVVLIAFFGVYKITGLGDKVTLGNNEILEGEVTMQMGEDNYAPTDITIRVGTTVTFINNSESLRWPASDLHPSHLIYSEFDSKAPVKIGERYSFTFNKPGEWGYHDHLAPYITGIINVVD